MSATRSAPGCVDAVFGAGGLLAKHLEGYRPRPGQIELANAIDDALLMGEHLIGEAGTGVGKSFAYLVPAIHHAANGGGRVIVATANIALQEQLVKKDLPFLQRILPWKFKSALRKGKGNYLCASEHDAYLMSQNRGRDLFNGGFGKRAKDRDREMERVLSWAETTETGDRNELPFVPSGKIWSRVSVGQDDCKGKRCRHFKQCHAMRAAREADDADIIVVNHHLLFADIKSGGAVLPPRRTVIIDEAHEAVSIARDFLGFRIGEGVFKRLAARMRSFQLDEAAADVAGAGAEIFDALALYRDSERYGVRLVQRDCVGSKRAITALKRAVDALEHKAMRATDDDSKAAIEVERERAKNAMACVIAAMTLEDDNMVIHLEVDDDNHVHIEGRPLDVSEILGPTLFATTPSVILTSATLTVDGSFDHAVSSLGIDSPVEIEVESPFDPKNRIMIIPRGMPSPSDFPDWPEYVAETVEEIIRLAGGRTLGLFTSHQMLRRVREHLDACLDGHRVLVQGDMPRSALLEAFREDIGSSLLGTRSLWAGVDVPGNACSVVVIDKMPFANPKDPIENAFEEKLGRRMFGKRMLPEAVIQFKQGAGRLIRGPDDRGALVVLDRRMVDKSYGKKFIDSLGEIDVSRDLNDIKRIIDGEATQDYYGEDVPF